MIEVAYLIGSVLFIATLCKQFLIVVESPEHDKLLISKILFFLFNIFVLLFTWLIRKSHEDYAAPFFIAAGLIGVWTYFINKDLQ